MTILSLIAWLLTIARIKLSIAQICRVANCVIRHLLQTSNTMAADLVHRIKQAGDLSVRQANGTLRFPGFKHLDGCQTTVDMDLDPEVFIMLDPIQVIGGRVRPSNDMGNSARRLQHIFRTTISFFLWRLPYGQKMLRENGIENLPGQIFDEIKTSLVQSDRHFSRFPSAAIKRCLLLFTENVLPQAPNLLPAGKGDTASRKDTREA